MKNYLIITLLGLCNIAHGQSKAVLGIQENFNKQEVCWNAADIECYMEAYATTEMIQTISRGGVTKGYDTIIGNYKKYYPKDKMGQLHFDQMEFRKLSGKYYYVVGRFNLSYEDQKEPRKGYFSVLMKRIKGQWVIVSDHSS